MPVRLLLLLVLACFSLATYGALDDEKHALIQELFPKATDIRDRLPDYPVYPVYQLQELIGYAYESRDISPLQGFAGKPVSMLIGSTAVVALPVSAYSTITSRCFFTDWARSRCSSSLTNTRAAHSPNRLLSTRQAPAAAKARMATWCISMA